MGRDDVMTVPLGRRAALENRHDGQQVILGARPETIVETGAHFADAAPFNFNARIDVVEPTGSDNLAIFNAGGIDVIARLRPGSGAAGQLASLSLDTSKALIFDPQSELLVA
ncbi:MAG: hypothetical protein E5V71_01785 [Mesorhizobium sp.]|nr:MAG: hypothetical protein E5V71_01785 [Mesorhizobium sp.]